MSDHCLSVKLSSADATANAASVLAPLLSRGDVLLLTGDVGAGKTHFARSVIKALLGAGEDVPSPTFTLVQTYLFKDIEIWHADLYRLNSTLEIEELGLNEAFEDQICMVEWPDKLGTLVPRTALSITLSQSDEETHRMLSAKWCDPKWNAKLKVWQDI